MHNRHDLLEALKKMSSIVDDNHGNVSCRIGLTEMVIKPSGMSYEEIRYDDIVYVDFLREPWTFHSPAHRKPSVDTVNHVALYKKFPDVEAICHTHSPYVVAWAIAGLDIPPVCTEQIDSFGGQIDCSCFVEDPDQWGEKLEITLGSSARAVLLEKHGGVTMSVNSPQDAVDLAARLEDVAKKVYLGLPLRDGFYHWNSFKNVKKIMPETVRRWFKRYNQNYGQ